MNNSSKERSSWNKLSGRFSTLSEHLVDKLLEGEYGYEDPKEYLKSSGGLPVIRTSYRSIRFHDDDSGNYDEDHGWIDEDGEDFSLDAYDIENETTVAQKAADWLQARAPLEPSSSHFYPGLWYIGYTKTNFRTGEETTRSYHLKGFSEDEEREIFNTVTKR